jgi:hypothetical protein
MTDFNIGRELRVNSTIGFLEKKIKGAAVKI